MKSHNVFMEGSEMEVATTARSGSVKRRQAQKELNSRWIEAGCPEHFVLEFEKGKGTARRWDLAARREHLQDLEFPDRARLRKIRGELNLKRKQLRQGYR